MSELLSVLMCRDGLSLVEAREQIEEAQRLVLGGADPEEVLSEEFGLEPDYVFDLLDMSTVVAERGVAGVACKSVREPRPEHGVQRSGLLAL